MSNDLSRLMSLAAGIGGRDEPVNRQTGEGYVRRISGTAVTDSASGKVKVQLAGGDPIEVPTSVAVKAGQTVSLLVSGGVATAVGVAGWGDGVQAQADAAATTATQAQSTATEANTTANTAKTAADTASTNASAAVKTANGAATTASNAQATANATATLIRQYSGGVLVAKTGSTVGALVNANGSFDVVTLTWSNGVPTAGTEIASFDGGRARIGNATEAHVVLRPQSLVFYADEAGNHLAEFAPGAVSVNDGDLKIKFGSGDIDGSNAAAIYGPTIGDGIILMPSESSNANLWICGDKAESGESMFAVHADNLMLARSGDPLKSFNMDHVIKLLGSSWQSAEVTLNTSSSLLGAHSASCLINPGLGLAYLSIDMSFESPGWQPGTGTWLFRLPPGLQPPSTKRLYNLLQIYINGRWGAHVDVHPDGYCYPTWGWQATNVMCNIVFPTALLGVS